MSCVSTQQPLRAVTEYFGERTVGWAGVKVYLDGCWVHCRLMSQAG